MSPRMGLPQVAPGGGDAHHIAILEGGVRPPQRKMYVFGEAPDPPQYKKDSSGGGALECHYQMSEAISTSRKCPKSMNGCKFCSKIVCCELVLGVHVFNAHCTTAFVVVYGIVLSSTQKPIKLQTLFRDLPCKGNVDVLGGGLRPPKRNIAPLGGTTNPPKTQFNALGRG